MIKSQMREQFVVALESLQVCYFFLSLNPMLLVESVIQTLRSRSITCDAGLAENLCVYPLWIRKEKFFKHVTKICLRHLLVSLDSSFP